MQRRCGYTFRKICGALIEASEGKKVAYVSNIQNASRYYFEMAAKIVNSSLSSEIKILQSNRKIIFPNGGYVEFPLAIDMEMKRKGINLTEYTDD